MTKRHLGLIIGFLAFVMAVWFVPALLEGGLPPVESRRLEIVNSETILSPSDLSGSVLQIASPGKIYLPLVFRDSSRLRTNFGVQIYSAITEESMAVPLARQAGVYWLRWPVQWSRVEPANTTPENFVWDSYDRDALNASLAGMHLVSNILSNPSWAATTREGPIDKVELAEFVEFVQALVERYDGDGWQDAPGSPAVNYWEFYNEPDVASGGYGSYYWGNYGAQYAAMLCAVYPAIKAANPAAEVVLGGIAYDYFVDQGGAFNRWFIDDVLSVGGGSCFDVMNFHYYPYFCSNWDAYGPCMMGKTAYLRNKLAEYGVFNKPMIITESGMHSDDYYGAPSSEQNQARYVMMFFTQAAAADIDILIWWTWQDIGGGYADYGLLRADLQPKPAYYAFQAAEQRLGRAAYIRMLNPTNYVAYEGYLFAYPDNSPLYILWARSGTQTVSIPLPSARITDMYGNVTGIVRDYEDGQIDGRARITFGIDPIYVEYLP